MGFYRDNVIEIDKHGNLIIHERFVLLRIKNDKFLKIHKGFIAETFSKVEIYNAVCINDREMKAKSSVLKEIEYIIKF
jgi:predicted lactoylglutathione lyase